ncbi:MAG: putative metalloprotease CJM1_0395 family protein [Pseudomonadota bacterium]
MSINLSPSVAQFAWQPALDRNTFYKERQNQQEPGEIASRGQISQAVNNENSESGSTSSSTQSKNQSSRSSSSFSNLTEEELKLVEQLKKADQEVRSHELAHIAAGGQYVTSGARLEYRKGPDGINYAVAGEVSIDTSAVPGDPKATAQKMRIVQRAALAPANPSAQDKRVAAQAASEAARATAELVLMQSKSRTSTGVTTAQSNQNSADAYAGSLNMDAEKGLYLDITV